MAVFYRQIENSWRANQIHGFTIDYGKFILTSNGPGYETTVSPVAANPICTFISGHFAEDDGEHYVCLTDESNLNELDNEAECLAPVGYSAPCSGMSSPEKGEIPVNGIKVCVDKQNSGDGNQASASRQNAGFDDQGSVGGINSGDDNQASVDRQNSGEDDQVSVGRQDRKHARTDQTISHHPQSLV